jgi:2-oxo-4-hydroxy-4-carboxy-5-ureidoimidazoline decarboxylase
MIVSHSSVLDRWNELDAEEAIREILPCCGSSRWAERLVARRPFASPEELCNISDAVWAALGDADWREAFDSHPRIGEHHARTATARSLAWSSEEQNAAASSGDGVKLLLAEANQRYEEKFGRIFIICAAGKGSEEILAILEQRMQNSPAKEMLESAEQQRQITQLRLRRWLGVSP